MDDERKKIGSAGRAGRGNKSVSPSAAARSLAGGSSATTPPTAPLPGAKKAAATKPGAKKASSTQVSAPEVSEKKLSAKKAGSNPAGTKASGSKKQPGKKTEPTTAAEKSAAASRSGAADGSVPGSTRRAPSATKAASKKPAASRPTTKTEASQSAGDAGRRHLRAVTDDDAKVAAAEAARLADQAKTPVPPQIPLDEIFSALIDAFQRVMGSGWENRLATLLYTLRKRLSGNYQVDDFGFDPELFAILQAALEPIAEKWFRLQVRGVDNIPSDGGALLVANHSGTLPLDGLMTGYAVSKHANRSLRPLGADLVFAVPVISSMARKIGATLACTEDAERLLASGELAGVWPEGFKGIGKPFSERYKLQRFGRGGFVSSAMRAQVPIIPVSIVGAEEIYPLVGNIPALARLLGLPYLPITPLFPLLGPLGLIPLPSKWIIEFGEPIRTDAYEPDAADDPMLLFNVTDQVRETIQQTLYRLLVERKHAFF